jgi:hypothetical protein
VPFPDSRVPSGIGPCEPLPGFHFSYDRFADRPKKMIGFTRSRWHKTTENIKSHKRNPNLLRGGSKPATGRFEMKICGPLAARHELSELLIAKPPEGGDAEPRSVGGVIHTASRAASLRRDQSRRAGVFVCKLTTWGFNYNSLRGGTKHEAGRKLRRSTSS